MTMEQASTFSGQLPLSVGQEQLWFLEQMVPGLPTYNVATAHRIRGPLDVPALRVALSTVVARHEMLRGVVSDVTGTPTMTIGPPPTAVELPVTDLSTAAVGEGEGPEPEDRLRDGLAGHAAEPFELTTGPLYRFRLFRLGPQEHVLAQIYHHMVTDGWSTTLLLAQLSQAYAAALRGEQPPALTSGGRYGDYVVHQREHLAGGGWEDQLQYWAKQLESLPPLELPTDRPRRGEPTFRAASLDTDLPAHLLVAARRLAENERVSLFMVLATTLAAVLFRYTGEEDIPIGTAMLGRTDPDLEDVVGYFTNMTVLRASLAGNPSFGELLAQLADTMLDAYDNQDVPFERVVDRLSPHRDPGRNPLFGVCVQLLTDQTSGTVLDLAGARTEAVPIPVLGARFDLSLTFVESQDRLRLMIEYATDLFDDWRIQAFTGHLARALTDACAQPGRRISELAILSEPEQEALLAAGTGEMLSHRAEPVHAAIARRAAEQPHHLAAVHLERSLTYAELERRAGVLAAYLRGRGVVHQQIVAVALERDLDALVALLGVLKAGAAFAVLDPAHPADRLEGLLQDCGASIVLTQSRLRDRIPGAGPARSVVEIDADWAEIEAAGARARGPWAEWAGRNSLAYVIYTSGSTGRPKGVLIEHRALQSFIASYRQVFDLGPHDRMLQLAALTFDMSQGEIFAGLTAGATLVLVDQDAGQAPDRLGALMRSQQVSYICMSPTMLALVESEPYPHLRKIMAGGEAVTAEIVAKWNLPGRRLINCYGPTEAAVGCTSHECPHPPLRGAPPIGVPFTDRRMYVVDAAGRLVPRGVAGELLIGGAEGLARGYLNQPELTAESFVADPFRPGELVYRSGDVVRWNADDELEFLGRRDGQVKLRGLRIELEEIESALVAHPEVGVGAVALRPDRRGENQLVGYASPVGRRIPDPDDLRAYLARRLPDYMIPTAWVILDRLPMTTARKVDRKALPDPVLVDPTDAYVPPATSTEAGVAGIYAAVLDLDRVSATAAFFAVGGNSLQAMRVVSRIDKSFGVSVRVRTMFADASVRGIAAEIDRQLAERGGTGAGHAS